MLVILCTPLLVAPWFYSHSVLTVTAVGRGLPLDLDISLTGCDLLALPEGSQQARLSYWRWLGSGTLEVVNNTLRVRAVNRRKILMMRCTLALYLPDVGSSLYHYNSAKIAIQPDHSGTQQEAGCSNTVQMSSIFISSLRLRGSLELNISTVARSQLMNLAAPSLEAKLNGGSFHLQGGAIDKVQIIAKDALAQVTTDRPVDVRVEDEKTLSQVSLAAPMLQVANSSRKHYNLSLSQREHQTRAMQLGLHGTGSRIYVQASRPLPRLSTEISLVETERSNCQPLQVMRGDGGGAEVVLLPQAQKLLSRLRQWLLDAKMHEKHRWIIYIHLLAPDAPLGMLELLSSPIYQAISLSSASLISGGMLQPHIERIVAPIGGVDWLFPKDPCREESAQSRQERSVRFAQSLLAAVSSEVDILKMNLTSARWLWNAKGDSAYTFQHVEAHGESFWRRRGFFRAMLCGREYSMVETAGKGQCTFSRCMKPLVASLFL
ncbi:unnamed protein product [Durusdinium trenchii]|uniref:Uncharacterized protein n=1 Tax=Durusdinium trenchii TaxID=1381693 RepID=A0ABP0IVZ9_9DINO